MAAYVLDAWYAAAAADEVGTSPLARVLLEEPVVLYRTAAGQPVALADRCVHRFARLSAGQVCGDAIACPYHGMRYGPDGACIAIPGQERIPAQARVRSFPVLERYGLLFVWMGDPALADPRRLVDIPQYGGSEWGLSRGYARFECGWRVILENLIDPAHTSFVHQRTIGNAAGDSVPLQARQLGEHTIECGRWIDNAPAVPIVQRFANPAGHVDRWQYYYVTPPCTSLVDFGALPTGRPHTPEEQARAPYRVLSYAFITPVGPASSHYFSFQLRNFAAADEAVTREFEQLYHETFEEDRLLLEGVQQAEERQPAAQPLLIASDSGVARLRRLLGVG